MAETRRALFRLEWLVDLPAEPQPGDRVALPFGELVVREVSWRYGPPLVEARTEREGSLFPVTGAPASLPDGVNLFAEVGPHLTEPGATWLASAYYGAGSWETRLDAGPAPTLEAALDAFPEWAEGWIRDDELPRALATGYKPRGYASLTCVEPSGGQYGRVLLGVELEGDAEGALSALEALCERAERLYGS